MSPIKNAKDFAEAMHDKFSDRYTGSLEEYLRAIWVLVNKYQHLQPSHNLFVQIFDEAFVEHPADFEEEWLTYNSPLDWNYRDGMYVIETLQNKDVIVIERNVSELRLLKHTLLFQISDLHKMRDNQLKDEYRYFGVQSPTGNSWYNFDVSTYLECGVRGMFDGTRNQAEEFSGCDWADLASLLEFGRLYE